MRNRFAKIILGWFMVAALGACAPKKLVIAEKKAEETFVDTAKTSLLNSIDKRNLQFLTLSLKGKANLNVDGDENNVSLNVRIKKDEKIWFSVAGFGGAIEAARGIITPDSIVVINRLQRTYIKKPFSFIHQYANSRVNFSWLQAILTNNVIASLVTPAADFQSNGTDRLITGTQGSLAFRVWLNQLLKTTELTINDAAAGQALKVNYGKHAAINNGYYPTLMKIESAAGNKKIIVDVEFTKVESNVQIEYPLSIPAGYELIN